MWVSMHHANIACIYLSMLSTSSRCSANVARIFNRRILNVYLKIANCQGARKIDIHPRQRSWIISCLTCWNNKKKEDNQLMVLFLNRWIIFWNARTHNFFNVRIFFSSNSFVSVCSYWEHSNKRIRIFFVCDICATPRLRNCTHILWIIYHRIPIFFVRLFSFSATATWTIISSCSTFPYNRTIFKHETPDLAKTFCHTNFVCKISLPSGTSPGVTKRTHAKAKNYFSQKLKHRFLDRSFWSRANFIFWPFFSSTWFLI